MAKEPIPKEIEEQSKVVKWLDERGIELFTATCQDTFAGFKGMNRMQKLGRRKGLPDLIICLPKEETESGTAKLVFLEMKRQKGGKLSPAQMKWICFINKVALPDVCAFIAFGANHAIKLLSELLKPQVIHKGPINEQNLEEILQS